MAVQILTPLGARIVLGPPSPELAGAAGPGVMLHLSMVDPEDGRRFGEVFLSIDNAEAMRDVLDGIVKGSS